MSGCAFVPESNGASGGGGSGGVITDNVTIEGDGTVGLPIELKEVFHDATLVGLGTVASPLSVVAFFSGTPGSVTFIGPGGALDEDNANFFYDNANNRLGIGTNTPGFTLTAFDNVGAVDSYVVHLWNQGVAAYTAIRFDQETGTQRLAIGYANNSVADARLRNLCFIQPQTDFVLDNTTNIAFTFQVSPTNASIKFANGGSSVVSDANTGKIRYTTTGHKFQVSTNGGAWTDLALAASTFTPGSVIFADGSGQLAEDNTNFFWDDTTNRLSIGFGAGVALFALTVVDQNVNGQAVAMLKNTDTAGYSAVRFENSAGTPVMTFGHGNSAVGQVRLQGLNYLTSGGGSNFVIDDGAAIGFTFVPAATEVALQLADGSAAAVSAASTGRFRYNSGTDRMQVSLNGAAYVDLATVASAFTQGSVIFADASGHLAQDNANFFWDDTNDRLLVGTNTGTSGVKLCVTSAVTAGAGTENFSTMILANTANAGYTTLGLLTSGGTLGGWIGYGNSAVGLTNLRNRNFFYSPGGQEWVVSGQGATSLAFYADTSSDVAGIGFLNNGVNLTVSAANTGRLRYNATAQRFQISENNGAYANLVTTAAATTFTDGSVIFANSSGQLAQDNTNFFWDDTNNLLRIGTPSGTATELALVMSRFGQALDCFLMIEAGTAMDAGIQFIADDANLDAAMFIDYSDAKKFKIAMGDVNSDADRVANTKFTMQQSGQSMLVASSTAGVFFVRQNDNTGYCCVGYNDDGGVFRSYFGFFPSACATVHMRSVNGIYSDLDIVFGNATRNEHRFDMDEGSASYELGPGASAAVSTAGHARIRYNEGTAKLQVSINGAAYADLH